MQSTEIHRLADLVAEKVEERLYAQGNVQRAISDAERLAQLRADLQTLSRQFDARDEVVVQVRTEIAEHGFLVDRQADTEGYPRVERLRPLPLATRALQIRRSSVKSTTFCAKSNACECQIKKKSMSTNCLGVSK